MYKYLFSFPFLRRNPINNTAVNKFWKNNTLRARDRITFPLFVYTLIRTRVRGEEEPFVETWETCKLFYIHVYIYICTFSIFLFF